MARSVPSTASGREATWRFAPDMARLGTAVSPLRPAGIANIDGTRVDVVSDGSFLDPGTPIVVTEVEGNRIVVRPAPARQEDRA